MKILTYRLLLVLGFFTFAAPVFSDPNVKTVPKAEFGQSNFDQLLSAIGAIESCEFKADFSKPIALNAIEFTDDGQFLDFTVAPGVRGKARFAEEIQKKLSEILGIDTGKLNDARISLTLDSTTQTVVIQHGD